MNIYPSTVLTPPDFVDVGVFRTPRQRTVAGEQDEVCLRTDVVLAILIASKPCIRYVDTGRAIRARQSPAR